MPTIPGSGLGGFTAIAAQPTYGAAVVTPTRTLTFKSNDFTFDPHPVQGGPYLAGGRMVDLGSARVVIYLDAKGTLKGDVVNTGHALLLASALGQPATLTQSGTTTAYQLGGTAGLSVQPQTKQFDMQAASVTTDGTQRPYTFHSAMITKAEWVIDRSGLVTYSYDYDAQYVEQTTVLITPSYPAAPVPFSGANTTFKVGAFGTEAVLDGIRKATFTVEHKMATDRIYLGDTYKSQPVPNERTDITITLDVDYLPAVKAGLYDLFVPGTSVPSVVATASGNAIGTSGLNDLISLNATNCFVQSGANPSLSGPGLVQSSIQLKGTIDAAGDAAFIAKLNTADTVA